MAILPVGAGAKEHGFHLPMGTDAVQAEFLAGRLTGAIDALVWPCVTYGYYPAFVAYAGSASLSRDTFERLIGEIISGLLGFGARAVLVLDTGISTNEPIAAAMARGGFGSRGRHLKVYAGPRFREAVARLSAQAARGGHADEIETSLMLAINPDAVDMHAAAMAPRPPRDPGPGPLSPRDASSPNYAPSGALGDPALASAAKGEALLQAMLADLIPEAVAAAAARE